ncbi:MAG TPA: TetR/AcrR family transcriptional regulator [Clostridia bacterium]|nr:TetR/AcrR family transcriptional regulator [Clostridia bacterium]
MEDKKAELFRYGKELFGRKGFKDTNVADITKMAGVAVGTFYSYYPSKEKLFMEIYLAENNALKRRLMATADLTDEPPQFIKKMIARNMEGIRSDPILSQWYNKDVFDKIERFFREENGLGVMDLFYRDTVKLIEMWQDEGKIRSDIDSGMIMAMFTAIINIDTYKEEIGLKYFPQLQEHLTEFVLKGLAPPNRPKEEEK